MKKIWIILVLVFICVIAALESSLNSKQRFYKFMEDYDRHYKDEREIEIRYRAFLKSLKRVKELEGKTPGAVYGINKFSDYTEEEKKNLKSSKLPAEVVSRSCLASGVTAPKINRDDVDVPASFDWRSQGVVTPVKNQEQCGSCWAFSTAENIESQYALKKGNVLTNFSEQMIVDCSTACTMEQGQAVCNQGCNGGWMWAAMTDLMAWKGIEAEDAYPYTGETGVCKNFSSTLYAPLQNYTCIGTDEDQIQLNLLSRGPLSIAMNADLLESYSSGVIDPDSWFDDDDGCDPTTLDHALLLVGYGSESGVFGTTDYWIIRNSWGADWGEDGYFRLIKGSGACGMNNAVTCAILE